MAILVEGYTDVLALHQEGLTTAVASMGTALTERQLRELRRLCSRLYLCFDSDKAGEAATLRGMESPTASSPGTRRDASGRHRSRGRRTRVRRASFAVGVVPALELDQARSRRTRSSV